MNLLAETIEMLAKHGKTPEDVLWVGNMESSEYDSRLVNQCVSWAKFKDVASIAYDNGYGGAEIAESLVVVGKDFWLERHEYDGSEWWEFKSLPVKPKAHGVRILAK